MAREQCRAPPRHSHGDPTSLAPHERLTDLAVVPREKPHTGAAAREQPRDSPVIERGGPSSPAWPRDQSRDLSPNASGGLTRFSPPSELQEIPVATREQSGVLCFHSRHGQIRAITTPRLPSITVKRVCAVAAHRPRIVESQHDGKLLTKRRKRSQIEIPSMKIVAMHDVGMFFRQGPEPPCLGETKILIPSLVRP